MLLRICLVYAWFMGPPCLSVDNLVYCKCFFLRIAFYFVYIYILGIGMVNMRLVYDR